MKEENSDSFEKVQLARNPQRPYTNDLLRQIFTDFVELHGDRRFADDPAIIAGFAKIDGIETAVIGQQKGRDTNQRRHRNFGMPKPEGYRKALRVMRLAEKFGRPVITFIDTPGAYPGIDAEERGQAEAIAFNLRKMASIKIPTIAVVLGEGGSGGALAIGVGDRILMMENAVYSVISPEGCAAILWKNASQASRAAESLRLTAGDLIEFELVDEVIPEKKEWFFSESENNSDLDPVTKALKERLAAILKELEKSDVDELLSSRYKKFRKMGNWSDRLTS